MALNSILVVALVFGWLPASHADSPPPPRITSFVRTGAQLRMTINSQLGLTNAIEAASDLDSTAWSPITNLLVKQSTYTVYDPGPLPAERRFYRVRAWYPNGAPTNMAYIPAGYFTMGSIYWPPVHTVFTSALYMERTEVSKALWDQVYVWAVDHGYQFENSGTSKSGAHPVYLVSWHDAVKWCNARSEREGRVPAYYTDVVQTNVLRTGRLATGDPGVVNWHAGYRLPTEAEWEKACRGGFEGRRYPWGETISCFNASFSNCDNCGGGSWPWVCPVGSFAPNGYGLYDVIGNVWEWCWDYYSTTYLNSSPTVDPRGPTSGTQRVERGGAWDNGSYDCMCASRYGDAPANVWWNVGLRTVVGDAP